MRLIGRPGKTISERRNDKIVSIVRRVETSTAKGGGQLPEQRCYRGIPEPTRERIKCCARQAVTKKVFGLDRREEQRHDAFRKRHPGQSLVAGQELHLMTEIRL